MDDPEALCTTDPDPVWGLCAAIFTHQGECPASEGCVMADSSGGDGTGDDECATCMAECAAEPPETVTYTDTTLCTLTSSDASFDNTGSCVVTPQGYTTTDTTLCTLTGSTDFGTTPGSCAQNSQTTHDCTYVAGVSNAAGDGWTVWDACTSSAVPTVACSYVAGVYSDADGDGTFDTVDTADSCTSITISSFDEVQTVEFCLDVCPCDTGGGAGGGECHCSDGFSADQASCEAASTGNWWTDEVAAVPEMCSDGTTTDQAECEAAGNAWAWAEDPIPGGCSDGHSPDQASCEWHAWECDGDQGGPPEW